MKNKIEHYLHDILLDILSNIPNHIILGKKWNYLVEIQFIKNLSTSNCIRLSDNVLDFE